MNLIPLPLIMITALEAGGSSVIKMVSKAEPMVQFVLLILLAFSIVSWGIIIYKLRVLKMVRDGSRSFNDAFSRAKKISDVYKRSDEFLHSPLCQIFRAGYQELEKVLAAKKSRESGQNPSPLSFDASENIVRAMRRTSINEMERLERAVSFLATVGSTSPFIGLFGTVWGIMRSFQKIGEAGSATLAVVGPHISEALIATAAGLFAAIPAVVFYNHFVQNIKRLGVDMDSFTADFINLIRRHL